MAPPNILLITLDQLRADSLSIAGHPVVRTPHLDALASQGVHFRRHFSQAAPCGPGRACLYTGTYQMNNRVVGNGTPLDGRFDNVARAARRAGYDPALFGYADQGIDPRETDGPGDPRLSTYQGAPPGFRVVCDLPDEQEAWRSWLADLGYPRPECGEEALATESARPARHGVSAYLTERFLEWLPDQRSPWFAHLSYWRPHPPYVAAGSWSTAYDPSLVPLPAPSPTNPSPTNPSPTNPSPTHEPVFCGNLAAMAAPSGEGDLRRLRAQYYGMISSVDEQLGRLWEALHAAGAWERTIVVVTSDHGEQLGDQGRIGKGGYFEASYHVPCIVRDPASTAAHGRSVDAFTENVDLFPTLCDAMGIPVPAQCDGLPLTAWVQGAVPPWWRDAAHWEYDWRWEYLTRGPYEWPWDRRLSHKCLAVRRDEHAAYVQFGDGNWRCFDLEADPGWGAETDDPGVVLPRAQAMLSWRSEHADRTLSDMLLFDGGVGRLPSPLEPDPGPAQVAPA